MHSMFMRDWVLCAPEDAGVGAGGAGGGVPVAEGGGADALPDGADAVSDDAGVQGGGQGVASAEVLQAQADELAREYNLDEADAGGEVRNPGEEGQEGQEGYALEFPEGFQATDEFTSLATPIARELGLDGKQAGAYAAGVILAIQQEEQANFRKTDAALKEKWGREYRANRAEAQRFYNWCLECGDFSPDDLRVFHSPKGVELLYKMSQRVGEGRSATPVVAGSQSDAEWAQAAYHDPKHPDYRALRDVDDPRFEKVRERYNRAMGLTM